MDLIAEIGRSRVGPNHCKSNRLEHQQPAIDILASDQKSREGARTRPKGNYDSTGTNSLRCYVTQIYSDGAAKQSSQENNRRQ